LYKHSRSSLGGRKKGTMASHRANARSNAAEASAQSRALWHDMSSDQISSRAHNQVGDAGELDWNEEWSSEEDDDEGSSSVPRLKVCTHVISIKLESKLLGFSYSG